VFSKNLLLGQRIAVAFAVSILTLIAIGAFSLSNLNEMQRESAWVSHTLDVLSEARLIDESVSRLESASRGYLLSGNDGLREEIGADRMQAEASLRKLQLLTIDNASQQGRLEHISSLLASRLAAAADTVAARDAGQAGRPKQVAALVQDGQAISAQFRATTEEITAEETRLLAVRQQATRQATALTRDTVVYGSLGALGLVSLSGYLLTLSLTRPLAKLRRSAGRIGGGDYAHRAEVERDDEVGHLGRVFNEMARQVEERQASLAAQDWLKSGLATFTTFFENQRDPGAIGERVLSELAQLVGAQRSVLYRMASAGGAPGLALCASHAAENPPDRIPLGEGLVGQCAAENRRLVLSEVPAGYLRVSSALGAAPAAFLLVQPVGFEGQVKAVLELASLQPLTPLQLELVERLAPSLGTVFQNLEAVARTEELLHQAQALTAQLQEQQLELTQTNEELEQTNEEMEQANEEMEEKTSLLANQKKELEATNRLIEQARSDLQEQARQLIISSTYKSNFLATMSHELRTPLNSLLILARLLSENRDGNLNPKQVQFARTIESSGADLLEMINQVLDLAKIESGTAELQLDDVQPSDLQRSLDQQFRHVAESKHLDFGVSLAPGLPERLHTDAARVHQVLKNLLSNAFKFTERGSVQVEIRPVTGGWSRAASTLKGAPVVVAFAVTDTGIGVPKDKQDIIFESFQQADAGTARRFGGTGLGLSISREIATMLGGSLQLESTPGAGSTFTLYLPARIDRTALGPRGAAAPAPRLAALPGAAPEPAPDDEAGTDDDRAAIAPGDRILLIIEDDLRFAAIVVDFAREKRFKALVARSARRGLALARQYQPVAITLDLRLVDEDGWMVLDRLKHDPLTRHIPVHLISVEEARNRGLRLGAVSYLQKPVTREALVGVLQQTVDFIERRVKNLLVVEDDPVQRDTIRELVGNGDVHTTTVGTAAEALAALAAGSFDCVVMDLMLPDQPGGELIREINRRLGIHAPPVIVYTGKELTPREETELRSLSESIIVKDARSPERLLDETALFLHRVQARLPEAKRRMLDQVRRQDAVLTGRRVLLVDDDVRNIFALTAALEGYGMVVEFAESGQGALDLLHGERNYDIVLMDVMMPGMDGNEATRTLRGEARFAKLPIIAVTAKAMKGDRERSIEAGASDYITKPVDTEKLISLLRVWLYR